MTESRPNVLMIGVDQMRADTPGFMGNEVCRTPHLDAFASESVVFERAYAPSSQCSPSRASMFTGVHAFAHGMGNNADMYHPLASELPRPELLLTRRLSEAGYRLGYVGKWHVGARLGPTDYGFEGMSLPGYGDPTSYEGYQRHLAEHGLSQARIREPWYGNEDRTLLAGIWDGPAAAAPARYLTERTGDLLKRFSAGGEPFFLTCQFWAPHPPYLPALEYAGRHDPADIPSWSNLDDDLANKPSALKRFRRDFYRTLPRTREEWRRLVGLYYDYTAQVDAEIGRLLARIDELGLRDDTIVAFTADHGDMTGSHGLFDKGFMYEEAHRVPLVVRWPDRWPPGRRRELATNMDILPTVLDTAGPPADHTHGRSLVPMLRGETTVSWRNGLLLESHGMRHLYSQRALVRDDGWKYIFNPSHEDELYDLNADPGELDNLLARRGADARAEEMRADLVDTMFDLGDPLVEYAAKLFGDWSNRSGQPDASALPGA